MSFVPTNFIGTDSGNGDRGYTNPGDLALLQVYNGVSFDSAIFSYTDSFFNPFAGGGNAFTGLIEIVDNISLVAEPGTYTMLLADLGLIGFMARRRKDIVE